MVFAGPDRVAVADESGAHLWNLAAGDVHTIVPPNELVPTGLAFDSEHGRLALAMGAPESNGVTIQVFDVDDPSAPIATVAGSEPMAFTPDGSTLVHRRGSQVAASAIETQQSRLLGPPIDPVALAIDAGSRYVAAGSADGRMLMLDLARGVAVGEPFAAHQTDPGASMDVSTSADGSTVMSVGSLEPVVVTWWYPDGWPEVACNAVRRNLNPEEWVEVFLDDPRRTTSREPSMRGPDEHAPGSIQHPEVDPGWKGPMTEKQEGPVAIRTPDQRLRVFVSSTLVELADERAVVARAISALGLTPVLFELGARPHPPRELYRAYLAQSDIFIGLYWQRYGWIGPDMEISGLEDEFRLSGSIPRLLYVKAPAPEREPRLTAMIERAPDRGDATPTGPSAPHGSSDAWSATISPCS